MESVCDRSETAGRGGRLATGSKKASSSERVLSLPKQPIISIDVNAQIAIGNAKFNRMFSAKMNHSLGGIFFAVKMYVEKPRNPATMAAAAI